MGGFKVEKLEKSHEDFLRDESKIIGYASSISFPVEADEVKDTVLHLKKDGTGITIQGARTGITAGAVPYGGHLLNLGGMDRITGMTYDNVKACFMITVQPGVTLSKFCQLLKNRDFSVKGWSKDSMNALEIFRKSGDWFFPVDPTETTATLGGMVSCNSSGACSYCYGPVRNYVEALDVILADGSGIYLRRGLDRADGDRFSITADNGKVFKGRIPGYKMPGVKNASGYYAEEGMDLVDLFIGSEGTLGVVTGITLRLIRSPAVVWGIMIFLASEEEALLFIINKVKAQQSQYSARIAAIEFFNGNSLRLLKNSGLIAPVFPEIPESSDNYEAAVYMELHGNNEDDVGKMAIEVTGMIETCGGNPDATWLASNQKDMGRLKAFRHAVPEAVNLIIAERKKSDPEITKLGTDMAVPHNRLEEIMKTYNSDLAASGLESVIFGHIGDNHVHVNILPGSMQEYEAGWKLYHRWARKVTAMGGTISAEHGVGKLKKILLAEMYGSEAIRQMIEVKRVFDPEGIFNRGNLFDI